VLGLLVLAGCGKSDEDCDSPDEGFFSFAMVPDDGPATFTGTLHQVAFLDAFDPPRMEYTFLPDGGGTVRILASTLGYSMGEESVDLETGKTYTVVTQTVTDEFLTTYGVMFSDDEGVVLIMESDWFAANNTPDGAFDYVLAPNEYGSLDLTVNFVDVGCNARVANSADYRSIRNWRLEFFLDGARAILGNKNTARLGAFEIHAWRAQQLEPKQASAIQPQLSWFLRRLPEGS